ncbi:hypothetical protein JF50_18400 [Pseudoalteromonas luteoviolacea]|uniref:Uncharacterized protein n=1 Tax=Pseudoalteromonas luteoviolacea TaxID=43657 RepID=A0A0C1Q9Z1_9GAMM|nr:hypothetical protein JF50_18400 [Pseudoalteromonas luteoviolacea]
MHRHTYINTGKITHLPWLHSLYAKVLLTRAEHKCVLANMNDAIILASRQKGDFNLSGSFVIKNIKYFSSYIGKNI